MISHLQFSSFLSSTVLNFTYNPHFSPPPHPFLFSFSSPFRHVLFLSLNSSSTSSLITIAIQENVCVVVAAVVVEGWCCCCSTLRLPGSQKYTHTSTFSRKEKREKTDGWDELSWVELAPSPPPPPPPLLLLLMSDWKADSQTVSQPVQKMSIFGQNSGERQRVCLFQLLLLKKKKSSTNRGGGGGDGSRGEHRLLSEDADTHLECFCFILFNSIRVRLKWIELNCCCCFLYFYSLRRTCFGTLAFVCPSLTATFAVVHCCWWPWSRAPPPPSPHRPLWQPTFSSLVTGYPRLSPCIQRRQR